ncbi:pilus assembly protein [Lentzea tibetensis]|uniref:Pilus assembly protein n=1 Tax=Lentzea tibetensis TaxID=2591470 RepID=A0A563EUQ8_9PSEU|nr:TadE family type IV pilus minor pilin [Lentzea tibetensis]TWP51416.1 pilus assembly protein [Lentzea tibetensis]
MSDDRGAATVEAAIAVCALLMVLAVAAAGVGTMIGQLRCTDAAREAARLVARGERDQALAAGKRIAPNAELTVHDEGGAVRVEVRGRSPLPGVRVGAEAFAVLEPG